MKTNILRCVALAIGLSAGTVSAQYGAYAPNGYSGGQVPQNTMPVHPTLMNGTNHPQQALPGFTPQATLARPVGSGQPVSYGQQQYGQPAFAQPNMAQPNRMQPNLAQPVGYGYAPRQLPATSPRVAMNGDQLLPQPQQDGSGGPVMQHQAGQPMPQAEYSSAPAYSAPSTYPSAQGCSSCNTSPQYSAPESYAPPMSYGSPYAQAVAAPYPSEACSSCAPMMMQGPAPVRNWFGGAGVMFMDIEDNCDTRLVFEDGAPAQTRLSTGDAGISSATGGNVFFGRYFGCGRYAVVANYWFLDPSASSATVNAPAPGAFRAHNPMWNYGFIDLDMDNVMDVAPGFEEGVYTLMDGASAYRVQRDIEIQNIEVSIIGFGIGGAGRMGVASCGGGCGSCAAALSNEFGNGNACNPCNDPCSCGPRPGCAGGPCGPIMPACGCRLRTTYGHGIRWFRFDDDFEFAVSRAVPGYGATDDDIYYNLNVRNDLIGYQFTGRLDYCLCKQFSMYAGGKAGIYLNDVRFRSNLTGGATQAEVDPIAYPTMANRSIVVDNSDTNLAMLGELDLGLTYTINPCWSINGGYRIMGVSGVATSTGQIAVDAANLGEAGQICADKSLLLHGAYIGGTYNY